MKLRYRIALLFFSLNAFFSWANADQSSITKYEEQIEAIEAYSEDNIQTLLTLIELFENNDESLLKNKSLLRLAKLYGQAGQTEQAIVYLDQATKLAESLGREANVEALIAWSEFETKRGSHAKAQDFAEEAVKLAKPDSSMLPYAYNALGFAQSQLLYLNDAKQNLELAVQYFKNSSDLKGLTSSYGSLGFVLLEMGDIPGALQYLNLERELIETIGGQADLASNYYNIGDAYKRAGDPVQAEVFFRKALEIDKTLGDINYIASDYKEIAYALYAQERFDEALENNQQALDLLLSIDSPFNLTSAYIQQVYIYFKKLDFEKSLQSLNLASNIANRLNVAHTMRTVEFLFGRQYVETNQPELAIEHLNKAIALSEGLGLIDTEVDMFRILADAYALKGDHAQAFENLKRSNRIKAKTDTEERKERIEKYKRDINLLEEQLKVSRLEKTQAEQAQQLSTQQAKQRQLYLVFIVVVLLFAVVMFVVLQRRKLSVLKVKLYEDALQQKQQLFADVSHELRTPLTALKLQIKALQSNLVEDVNTGYSKLARKVSEINRLIADIYQLAQADSLSIELVKEDVHLQSLFELWEQDWKTYIEAIDLNWESNFDLHDAHFELDKDRIKQVIDNLLANSVHYTDVPGKVKLSASIHKKKLIICVEDSAPGVESSKLKKIFTRLYRIESSRNRQTGGSGLGLAICESLVEAHGGTIRAEQSELGGLKVVFEI
jgi:signal transduction histidine kinase